MSSSKSIEQVMNELQEKAPALLDHIYQDRSWLWYAGPSLAPVFKDKKLAEDPHKANREALRAIGFRFARAGHPLGGAGLIGSWGHSCQRPTRSKPRPKQQRAEEEWGEESERFDPVPAMAGGGGGHGIEAILADW